MKNINKARFVLIALLISAFVFGTALFCTAGNYPERTITIINPSGVGGSADVAIRGIIPFLEKHLNVPVVTESMTGAGGRRAMNYLWKAKPDGYTLAGTYFPSRLIGQLLDPEDSYYDMREFEHVAAWIGGEYRTILARANDPNFKTMQDVVDACNKRRLTMAGGGGIGSTGHLQGVLLKEIAGLNIEYIPFDAGAQAIAACLGGHTDLLNQPLSTGIEYHKKGELKVLAVHAPERVPELPDVPTLEELGYEGMVLSDGIGIWAPPGTPKDIVAKLEETILAVAKDPEFIKWADNLGIRLLPLNSKEFLDVTLYDYKNFSAIIDLIKE